MEKYNNKQICNKYGDSTYMLLGKVDGNLALDVKNVNKSNVLFSNLRRYTVRI